MHLKVFFVIFIISLQMNSQDQKPHDPFAHTYSIVARDAKTGEMGVAVQSHWFNVGTVVPWAEAGVGVVATQSFANVSFGPKGLALLKEGKSPQEVLDILLSKDPSKEFRQVAIMDKVGRVATFTGRNCIDHAGQKNGQDFSVQANMMLTDKVVGAMEKTWLENSDLPLAERMIAVLKSAEDVGGDIRGRQSAAIIIVKGEASSEPWSDRIVDLRVDDDTFPVQELDRLLKVSRAYDHMNEGDIFVAKNEMEKARKEYNTAMEMFPDNLEMQFWTAIALANDNRIVEAAKMLHKIYRRDPQWRKLTKRLPKAGLLKLNDARDLQALLE
ncbi:DUF1028 domain-containing protein [Aequorivita sp. H23M31]|uniref:DUF1028 domain-containing protein n=1 Tax=Aequorivita ciconiae TaxID=2494375 RepID=A0A410G559_9FLAO|nr:DUF1028 domain-containing protein [Aequorivita sp. H23M31]QAA82389.1 DUF1028 domain-containing protein [Aequorivita sp. H23M31]